MNIYNFSKFYTLNILAYSIWIADFIYILFFLLTLSPQICKLFIFFDKYFVIKFYISYFIYYFYLVIFLIFSFLIEIVLRKLNKITKFNQIYGNPKLANILFRISLFAIPTTYFILYKLVLLVDRKFFID